MTDAAFHKWLFIAKPGECTIYYVGYLACDRERQPALHALADQVYEAQEGGFVELTQRRIGNQRYAYRATRTKELVG